MSNKFQASRWLLQTADQLERCEAKMKLLNYERSQVNQLILAGLQLATYIADQKELRFTDMIALGIYRSNVRRFYYSTVVYHKLKVAMSI